VDSKLPLVIGALVVFGALTAGILYSNYNSVAVSSYTGDQFKASGVYNASSNELKGTVENLTGKSFDEVEVQAKFYKSQGTILDTGKDYFRNFKSGEKYQFRIWFNPEINDNTGEVRLKVSVAEN
jgi:hypothetical protein